MSNLIPPITEKHWLTHWGLHRITAILKLTFSNAFSWMGICIFWFKLNWITDNKSALVHVMAWCQTDPDEWCIHSPPGTECHSNWDLSKHGHWLHLKLLMHFLEIKGCIFFQSKFQKYIFFCIQLTIKWQAIVQTHMNRMEITYALLSY